MPKSQSSVDMFLTPKVMSKVKEYGYNHLLDQEKAELALELIGYENGNPGFESVTELFDSSPQKLNEYFSKTQIVKLRTIRELSAQYLKEELIQSKALLSSPESVQDFLKLKIGADSREQIISIFVDSKNQVIDCKIMATGTVDQAVIYPREILKEALECNATGLILAHNHPSGEPEPSGSDIRLTEQLKKGAEALNMNLLDHMIVGGNKYFSFLENSIMEERAEYVVSSWTSTQKEFLGGKTLAINSDEPERNVSKVFENAITELKENEKYLLNKRLEKLLGGKHLKLDDLPNTMYIIDKTYNSFISEYHSSGYVDFKRIENQVGTEGSSLYRIFDKEVYSFFEKNFLDKDELNKFTKLIPEAKTRQSLFADYVRKKPLDLSRYSRQEMNFVEKMFDKIIKGFTQLLGKKNELEMLFEDFKHGRYDETGLQQDKMIINASELDRYDSLKGVDMIIGDVDFRNSPFPDLGNVQRITGKAIFGNSKIHSLGNLHSVGELDLRDSFVDDLGGLKKVHGNVYSNSIHFENWEKVEIEKDIFSFRANMTEQYKNLRNTPSRDSERSKSIAVGMER